MSENSRTALRSLVAVSGDELSPASNTFKVGTGVVGFSVFKTITFVVTIAGGTGGVLDVLIEHSPDGARWYEYVHFAQLTAAQAAQTYTYPPALNDNIVLVGKNNLAGNTLGTTMVLAAGSTAGGHWFDQLRVRYVAGVSTSAGATQVVDVLCVDDSGRG